MKIDELITDELWGIIEPILPPPKPRRFKYPGRKPKDPRKVLTGIVYILKTGIPWEMLPQELGFGTGMTCWRYLHAWQQKGIWKKIHSALLSKLREANKIDFSRAVVDSSSVRAVLGGPKRGRTRRIAGKKGQNTTSLWKLRGYPLRSMSRRRTATT